MALSYMLADQHFGGLVGRLGAIVALDYLAGHLARTETLDLGIAAVLVQQFINGFVDLGGRHFNSELALYRIEFLNVDLHRIFTLC